MTRLIASILSSVDLPGAELCAARLDGEVFAVDECYAPVDEFDRAALRAAALSAILPPRLIAELLTAAWVHGAVARPPLRLQLCADSTARYSRIGVPRLDLRQVVLEPADTVALGGMRVTSPLRTALDLARFCDPFTRGDAAVVAALGRIGRFGLADSLADVERRRHLPGKTRAAAHLRAALTEPPR